MKDKVLLVSPYSDKKVGGIGTWTKNILDYRDHQAKFDVYFLNTAFKFKSNIINCKLQRISIGIIDSSYLIFLFIIKIILIKPKTIHYTSSASISLLKDYFAVKLAKLIGVKFIIHWHFGRIPELYHKQNFEWRLLNLVAKSASISIVLDEKSFRVFDEIGIKNVKLIPNTISMYLQEVAEKVELENGKNLNNCIVYVGHIIPEKGVRELIEAFCTLKEELNLIMIGPINKDFQQEILSNLAKFNKTEFVSWTGEIAREEVFHYLKTSKALCLPSYTEGFPNVIIEAMALGCPIIATKVGAIEEMVTSQDMGNGGICIEPKNVEQIIDAIIFITHNKEKSLGFGKNGNKRVLTKYTLSNVFHQYEALWSTL